VRLYIIQLVVTRMLSHPSVSVAIGSHEIDTTALFGPQVRFKTTIKWKLNNSIGLCNLASQLQMLRRKKMMISYLLLLDLDVAQYRSSIRYIQKIMDDPRTSIILFNLNKGVPAFLLDSVNHVIEGGNSVSASFDFNDLPVRKLALVVSKQLGPYLEALNLRPDETVTVETVRAKYKRAVLWAHPDKGGNADDFERITTAYDVLIGWLGK